MSDWRILRNTQTDQVILARVRLCKSFWCHFKGLQFAPPLENDEGLLFITDHEGCGHTSIHMFFVFFNIAVIWLDASGKVVDKKLAKVWRPYYAPVAPAQYFLEANPELLDRVQVGDVLRFDEVAQ
jgi:uncharacterized membrane protein (UPF0127 family)